MEKSRLVSVSEDIHKSGITVSVGGKKYRMDYPEEVWETFPKEYKEQFAQTAAVFFTQHLSILSNRRLSYDFPPPSAYSLFSHGYLYSVTSAPYEFPKGKFRMDRLIRDVYNAGYASEFHGHPAPVVAKPYVPDADCAVMAFSFGKDSLLTYAMLRTLKKTVHPFFFEEPTSPYENTNKRKLRESFSKEFNQPVTMIPITLGSLREGGGVMWGWDMLLDQYSLLLLPYIHRVKPAYFLWSNEQSTNTSITDPDGYIVNPTHEQSVQWMLNMNNLLRLFGSNAALGSILEPLHELAELSLLHTRFREIGKYQLSCFNDDERSKTQRWCGKCHECARVYILLLGAGIDPKQVDFRDDMLDPKKKHLHHLFDDVAAKHGLDVLYQSHEERMLAFYLAYKRGVRGGLMKEFEKRFLSSVSKRAPELIQKYVSLKSDISVPADLKKDILRIYTEHLNTFRKDIMSSHLAPVGKS